MYYFSDKFLTGLKSKSENFQNEFFYVVDRLCQDSGDDQFIQAMIEQELSYDHPGNLINYSEQIWGGEPQCRTEKEWVQKICETVHDLFEEEEWGEYHGLDIATHLFISVHLPEDVFSDAATDGTDFYHDAAPGKSAIRLCGSSLRKYRGRL